MLNSKPPVSVTEQKKKVYFLLMLQSDANLVRFSQAVSSSATKREHIIETQPIFAIPRESDIVSFDCWERVTLIQCKCGLRIVHKGGYTAKTGQALNTAAIFLLL